MSMIVVHLPCGSPFSEPVKEHLVPLSYMNPTTCTREAKEASMECRVSESRLSSKCAVSGHSATLGDYFGVVHDGGLVFVAST